MQIIVTRVHLCVGCFHCALIVALRLHGTIFFFGAASDIAEVSISQGCRAIGSHAILQTLVVPRGDGFTSASRQRETGSKPG